MMSERNDATICAGSKTDDSRSETENTQLNEAQKELLRAINAEDFSFKCAEEALRNLKADEVIQTLDVWKPVHTSLPVQFFVMGLRAAITEIKRAEPEAKPVSDGDFFDACRNGKEITVQQFIAQGGNIEMRDGNGRTGLIIAAWYEKWDVLRSLAAHGADLNAVGEDGFSALSIALCANYVPRDVPALLVTPTNVDEVGIKGFTPLCFAAKNGHQAAIRMLIEKGANPNHKKSDGFTPMMLAILNNNIGCANELMRHGAKLELPPEEKEASNA